MYLISSDFQDGAPMPESLAFCRVDPVLHAALGENRSPALEWGDLPAGTASLVLTCVDGDVPTCSDDVNQEGRTVPHDLARTDFVHWVMVDLPALMTGLANGACSIGVVAGGKKDPPGPDGVRQGLNDYGGWFGDDEAMGGDYLGYDGPAPPWNDERLHHYRFTLSAVDLERLDLPEPFTSGDVRQALAGHVLGEASLVGTYTLNPAVAAGLSGPGGD